MGAGGGSLGYTGISPSEAMEVNIYPSNTMGGVGSGVGFVYSLPAGTFSPAPVRRQQRRSVSAR